MANSRAAAAHATPRATRVSRAGAARAPASACDDGEVPLPPPLDHPSPTHARATAVVQATESHGPAVQRGLNMKRFNTILGSTRRALLPSESQLPLTLPQSLAAQLEAEAEAPSIANVAPSYSSADLLREHAYGAGPERSALERLRAGKAGVAVRRAIASSTYVVLVVVTTLWAVASDDFRVVALPPSVDDAWSVVMEAVFAFFVLEVVLFSVFVRGYFFSFFYFLDCFATLSLIPDFFAPDGLSTSRVARAARAIRVFRMMRGARLAQVGNAIARKSTGWWEHHTRKRASILERTLVHHTHMLIVLGTVALIVGVDVLSPETPSQAAADGLCILHRTAPFLTSVPGGDEAWEAMTGAYRDTFGKVRRDELMHLSVRGVVEVGAGVTAASLDLRTDHPAELVGLYCEDGSDRVEDYVAFPALPPAGANVSVAWVSLRQLEVQSAVASLSIALFVLVLLLLWLASFTWEFHQLVLIPLERMITHLNDLMHNPLKAVEVNEREISRVRSHEMEVVEASLLKQGRLLQLGFGEAGARIIARSLNGAMLDPMTPGNKVQAIFGFCDIRSFTDCCEVLREHTLEFANEIALIIGRNVHQRSGAVNKNIGDAFLVVWKLKDSDETDMLSRKAEGWGEGIAVDKDYQAEADTALQAFLAATREVAESERLQQMSAQHLLHVRMPEYTVRLGYGLHLGWAIEGAVGSIYKIDATYLSPHVNIASRLESLTKMYGVDILMSGQFTRHLSPGVQRFVRPVDRVMVKGSKVPVLIEAWDAIAAAEASDTGFIKRWQAAFDQYLAGEWAVARTVMEELCAERDGEDRPARLLLDYMAESEFSPPPGWSGCRKLTSK